MDGQSSNILSKKLAKLKELYPEAITENKIDWEKLKAAFGDDLNFSQERYHLNWAGKSEVFRVLLKVINQAIVDEILKLQPKNVIALDKLFAGNDQINSMYSRASSGHKSAASCEELYLTFSSAVANAKAD